MIAASAWRITVARRRRFKISRKTLSRERFPSRRLSGESSSPLMSVLRSLFGRCRCFEHRGSTSPPAQAVASAGTPAFFDRALSQVLSGSSRFLTPFLPASDDSPSVKEHAVRTVLYGITFGVSYICMLLAMYFNGGVILGKSSSIIVSLRLQRC